MFFHFVNFQLYDNKHLFNSFMLFYSCTITYMLLDRLGARIGFCIAQSGRRVPYGCHALLPAAMSSPTGYVRALESQLTLGAEVFYRAQSTRQVVQTTVVGAPTNGTITLKCKKEAELSRVFVEDSEFGQPLAPGTARQPLAPGTATATAVVNSQSLAQDDDFESPECNEYLKSTVDWLKDVQGKSKQQEHTFAQTLYDLVIGKFGTEDVVKDQIEKRIPFHRVT